MDNRYTIKRADERFVDELASLEVECFENDPWSRQMFADLIKNDNCIIDYIEDLQLSKIIGYSVICCAYDQADLANIAVLPEFRRNGIGQILLEEIFKKCIETGVLELFLEVRASNVPAISLYKKNGFVEIGKRRNYYSRPKEDALVMMKTLEV